ncbi:MAG: Mth938-like domain-containing protein [Alphaproteobacteria bacterium]
MDVTPLVREGAQIVQSYAGGRFRVSGAVYEGAVIVFPDRSRVWAVQGGVEDLSVTDFEPFIERAGEIDVVLLGVGARMRFLPAALKSALKDRGLRVDTMDTGAACRTYNVLMAEGRRVAAGLFPV